MECSTRPYLPEINTRLKFPFAQYYYLVLQIYLFLTLFSRFVLILFSLCKGEDNGVDFALSGSYPMLAAGSMPFSGPARLVNKLVLLLLLLFFYER